MKSWKWGLYALLATWALMTWYSGGKIERIYTEQLSKISGREYTFITVGKGKFERGFFTSNAETIVQLRPDPCKPPVEIVVREKIRNDPLLGGGVIKSNITLDFQDDALSSALKKASPDLPPLTLTGIYHLSGRREYQGQSPAMVITDSDGSKLDWKGMTLTAVLDRDDESFDFQSGGIHLTSGDMDMAFDTIHVNSSIRPTAIGLDVGESEFSLGSVSLNSTHLGIVGNMSAGGLGFKTSLALNAGKAESESSVRFADLKIGKDKLSFAATFALNHIDTEAMKKLVAAGRESRKACHPDVGELATRFGAIFDGTAELTLKQLEFKYADKTLHMDGVVKGLSLPVNSSDIGMQMLADGSLLHDVDMQFKVTMNEAMLVDAPGANSPRMLARLREKVLANGIFTQAGDSFITDVTYRDDQLRLNGTPWSQLFPSGSGASLFSGLSSGVGEASALEEGVGADEVSPADASTPFDR
ncbi:uncharacterized protein YdgA (DUF945 family) [Fluviicoccus keumensis]|uniref:Uncharacterized protein YdgA (DUF945 family) n=1 Tax=Fluviicoccus keumensis TaxID=1435465 RepID=A0A4Q7Z8J2_9GAMM|nr:DUF945 family protein [Fluviicoccus keumensis]RZU46800.1 uncharacterized protein YdgA (DUF945 family) [Fluviicoccus keumensis]